MKPPVNRFVRRRSNRAIRYEPIGSLAVLGMLLVSWFDLWAQPVPHHFSGIAVLPDKTVSLSLNGSVSQLVNLSGTISNQFMQMFDLYVLEDSPNLTDWTRLAMLLRMNNNPSPVVFVDTNAGDRGQRFYRTFTNHLLTAFSNPGGPFAVGTADRVMMDSARTNLYRYSPPTNAFMVTIWYPADPPAAGVLPATIWDEKLAADASFYSLYGADTRWASLAPKLLGHRFRDVPLAGSAAKYPVILYSHGFAGSRRTQSQIAEELASHGYVVMALDHTDCFATEFPDGRYLHGNISGGSDVSSRLQDMLCLLGELDVLNTKDPLLTGRLDLDRIGVSGISAGGMVVETCRSDNRVRCAALWEGADLSLSSAGLQKPFLAEVAEQTALYAENQWLFSKAITNACFLQIRNAVHETGSDAAWTLLTPSARGPAEAINACLVWFFDTYLKGETPEFPTNPEIYNVHRK